jgi:hypothetical protein
MDIVYTDKCRYEIQEQKKFRYGIPAYTRPFRAVFITINFNLRICYSRFIISHIEPKLHTQFKKNTKTAINIERRVRVVNNPTPCSRAHGLKSRPGDQLSWQGLRGFPQSFGQM